MQTAPVTSLYSYFSRSHVLWEPFESSQRRTINVTEVWCSAERSGLYTTHHYELANDEITNWLAEASSSVITTPVDRQETSICLSRVVWIDRCLKSRVDDISASIQTQVVKAFGHSLVQEYYRTSAAGTVCLTPAGQEASLHNFSIHPKLAMTWSRHSKAHANNVICIAESSKIAIMKQLLDGEHIQSLCRNDMLPALLCAILCSREIDTSHELIKRRVRGVEVRTGHHGWASRTERPTAGDLPSLSAQMSGCSTKAASSVRKLDVLCHLLARFTHGLCIQCGNASLVSGDLVLQSHVQVLEQRAALQRVDAQYIESRVRTQLNALFHLTTEKDAILGHEMAKHSRALAQASYRDSSSMKQLAIVTMFFLPGTFISSLFSIPLFDWNSMSIDGGGNTTWRAKLAIYFCVAGPLTILTFVAWYAGGAFKQRWRRKRCNSLSSEQTVSDMPISEIHLKLRTHATENLGEAIV